MNRQIRQLEDDIISVLNGYDLPIEVKRLVLVNVCNLAEKEADKAISSEIIVEHGELENAEST